MTNKVVNNHRLQIAALFFACLSAITGAAGTEAGANSTAAAATTEGDVYDLVLRGGTIYDGSGQAPYIADVAIAGQLITHVGKVPVGQASREINVAGLAVAPGFINTLSWAGESLLVDGRSQSDIRQGVTLEVFGEGRSMGPINSKMRQQMLARQGEIAFAIPWTTLGEYLQHLQDAGVATNVASFVGATTVRVHELGYDNRQPTPAELRRMQQLVATAMQEGALGVGSSLIYAPGYYAQTAELVALMQTAANYGGTYISHIRSEGGRLLESIDELIHIARHSGAPAQIYHLKVSGRDNWHKFDEAVARINTARSHGLQISANMYTYTAGSTGLDAAMPPWVQEGGYAAWAARLTDPQIRARVATAMQAKADDWENLLAAAGADKTLLVGFRNPELRHYTGMTLAAVAQQRGTSVADTTMDLVIEDGSRVQVVYFLMSEPNVRKTVALPWVSFGSDAASMASEGVFLQRSTHPRAYGNFARVLGKYAREEKVLSVAAAVRKLSALPAAQLKLSKRGHLAPGYYADVAVFDPTQIRDHATYAHPHQYATGMIHVLVNGEVVLEHGTHTGRTPGQVVRGPGWDAAHPPHKKRRKNQ